MDKPPMDDCHPGNLHTTENMKSPYMTSEPERAKAAAGPPPPPPSMPTSVKIGPVTYSVSVDEQEWRDYEHERQEKGFYAKCFHMELRILINPATPEDFRSFLLWHEVMHAMFEQMMGSPLWLQDLQGLNKEDQEESIIRRMEYPSLQVLRDNPGLVMYLLSHE